MILPTIWGGSGGVAGPFGYSWSGWPSRSLRSS